MKSFTAFFLAAGLTLLGGSTATAEVTLPWSFLNQVYTNSAGWTNDHTEALSNLTSLYAIRFDAEQELDRVDIISGAVANNIAQNKGGYSLFVRGSDTEKLHPEVGIYNGSSEQPVVPRHAGLNPLKVGESGTYSVVYNESLNRARVYVNDTLLTEFSAADYGLTTDSTNVGAGSLNGGVSNVSIGSVVKCVEVGKSSLIGSLDYSETFTPSVHGVDAEFFSKNKDSQGTATDYYLTENCYGNPQTRWTANYSLSTGYDTGRTEYEGAHSGAGSDTGFSQASGNTDNYIAYNNLRDQFVIQMDAIQTNDRVGFGVGTSNNISQGKSGFSLFFRKDSGKIGIYVNGKETELLNGKNYGISYNEWNNYAARVDALNLEVELFANEWSLGTFDLKKYGLTSLDAKNIGYTLYGSNNRVWSDNFQVGGYGDAIDVHGVAVGASELTGQYGSLVLSDDFHTSGFDDNGGSGYRGGKSYFWRDNGKLIGGRVEVTFDPSSQYYEKDKTKNLKLAGGTNAGSATGAVRLGNNSLYTTDFNAKDSLAQQNFTKILMQLDAVQPANGFGLLMSSVSNNVAAVKGDKNSLAVLFNTDDTIELFTAGITFDITDQLDLSSVAGFDPDTWYNYALGVNLESTQLDLYVDEQLLGSIDYSNYMTDDLLANYLGFYSSGSQIGIADNFQVSAGVPEPSTWALLLLGLGGLYCCCSRKGRK